MANGKRRPMTTLSRIQSGEYGAMSESGRHALLRKTEGGAAWVLMALDSDTIETHSVLRVFASFREARQAMRAYDLDTALDAARNRNRNTRARTMTDYTCTIFDSDPSDGGDTAWPHMTDIAVSARQPVEAARIALADACEEARACVEYASGNRLWVIVDAPHMQTSYEDSAEI